MMSVKVKMPEGSFANGSFALHDNNFNDSDNVQLDLLYCGRIESIIASDYFEALMRLRMKLEPQGVWLLCNGAVENVYPSAMARSMGSGLKAYKLTLGMQAKTEDLVPIFEESLGLPPASVETQRAFYQEWLKSLKRI